MNATMRTAIVSAADEILEDRIEVDPDKVIELLAHEIVNEHVNTTISDEAITTGINAAIDEIDESAFGLIVNTIRERVNVEVEDQAKAIALRMLRAMAAEVTRQVNVEVL